MLRVLFIVHFFNEHLLHLAPADYTAVDVSLTFTASDSTRCASIPISADALLEDDEMFSAQLSTDDSAVTFSPQTALVLIDDINSEYSKYECRSVHANLQFKI